VEILRCGILLTAFAHDGGAKAGAKVVREFVEMRVAIDFDSLLGGVADDIAVVAPLEVILQLRLRLGIDGVVEIIC
jgi:hypothetical protein